MANATLTKINDQIIIKSPYNASLVEEIKQVQGRRWNGTEKAWTVPADQEAVVREIVQKFFAIEGEQSTVEYSTVHVIVRAKASSKRSYLGGVIIDGHDIINMNFGSVRRNDDAFEVISEKGGFVRGDARHAWEVEYDLVLKCRKGATFQTTGRADHWGDFEFIHDPKPEPTEETEASSTIPAITQQSFKASEAASFLGISLRKLGDLRRKGKINAERVNSRVYRYSLADLQAQVKLAA